MNRARTIGLALVLGLAAGTCLTTAANAQVAPGFTFQGKLRENNTPANGTYQFYFLMYQDSNSFGVDGNVGDQDHPIQVDVQNGLFTTQLDFPASLYDGSERWIQVYVRANGNDPWTRITPRQRISPAPYAVSAATALSAATSDHAVNADQAANATNAANAVFAQNVPGSSTVDTDHAVFGTDAGFKVNISGTNTDSLLSLSSPYAFGALAVINSQAAGGHRFALVATGPASAGGAGQFIIRDLTASGTDRLTIGPTGDTELGGNLLVKNSSNANAVVAIDSGLNISRTSAIDFRDQGVSAWGMGKDANNNFYIGSSNVGNAITIAGDTRNVGIQTSPNASFALTVNGAAAKPGGGSWAVFSDSRLKHDIEPLSGTLDKLLSMHGYHYEYNADAVEKRLALPGPQVGLLAEEVQRVFPDWVGLDQDGYRYVTERSTTALMVEALRDLRTEKDTQLGALNAQNADLRPQNDSLRARLDRIEASLRASANK